MTGDRPVAIRFLHLVQDSPLMDGILARFDEMVAHNRYLFRTEKARYTFRNITRRDRVEVFAAADRELARVLADGDTYDVLVLHSLYAVDPDLLSVLPDRVRVWWISWGYDLYGPHLIDTELFGERTAALRRELGRNGMGGFFKKGDLRDLGETLFFHPRPFSLIHERLRKRLARRRETDAERGTRERTALHRAIGRITYCSTTLPEEYELLAPKAFFTPRYIPFNYVTHDLFDAGTVESAPFCDGDGILIGNSATFENNHADVLEHLRRAPLPGGRIVVPLSYGDPVYGDRITQLGRELFGDRFHPVLDFLPFPQYAALLRSCPTALFGHERQQALGAVLIALWNGSTVFLSPTSVIYRHLKNLGVDVLSLSDDLPRRTAPTLLPRDTLLARRRIISREYSSATRVARMHAAIERIAREIPSTLAQ
ncbi:MAG TPA: TDP-N-acetylfucosamine:lipid II N-acetylfucosaminyltransferase [bacterium]|nr:TDP-N-acetylfucosamine:lipid II N-acetylfucosaminyltransferase [bacterium]